MQSRTLGSLTVALLCCSAVLGAQAAPQTPGAPVPGPAAQRPQTSATPPRDPNGNPNTQQPTGTGVIRGRVTAADSGVPVRRAQVRINSAEGRVAQGTNTDGNGLYEFPKLPAGRYTISVTRSGYVTLQFGQQRPFEPGKPLQLSDGEVAEKIDFALPRGGVITGRITDEVGEPIAGVQVMAMRYQYTPDGQRRLSPANTGPSFSGGTDDLGQFRVYGLMPGSYVLSATSRDLSMMMGGPNMTVVNNSTDPNNGYVTTYYPGTPNPDDAQALAVTLGQEASAFFSLVPARMSRISGVVRMSDGRAANGYIVSLRTVTAGMSSGIGGMQVGADGTFRLANVPPGEHFLDVRSMFGPGGPMMTGTPGSPPPEPEFASVPFSVSGQDIDGLVITTTTGATISGRVIFQATGATTRPTGGPNPMRVIAAQADPGPGAYFGMNTMDNGIVDEAGRFQIRGAGGRVVFRWSGPQGWFLKSVTMNGTDITDVPLDLHASTQSTDVEVVVTDQQTIVSGTVKDSRGQPVKDYVVAILPDGLREGISASRFIRVVRPDQNGQYKTAALPPGAYVAFAVETLDQGGLYDPAYQQEMKPRAKSFRLEDGQTLTLDLQLVQ
jgi:hypothetical protein